MKKEDLRNGDIIVLREGELVFIWNPPV